MAGVLTYIMVVFFVVFDVRLNRERIKMGRIEGWNLISHKFGAEFILFPSSSSMDTPTWLLCVWAHTKVWQKIWKNFFTREMEKWGGFDKKGKEKTKNCWQGRFSLLPLCFLACHPLTSSALCALLFSPHKSTPSFHHHCGVEWKAAQKTEAVKFFIFHLPLARIAWRNFHDFFFLLLCLVESSVSFSTTWRKSLFGGNFSPFFIYFTFCVMCVCLDVAWVRVCRRHLTTFRLAVVYMNYFYYIYDRGRCPQIE